MRLAAFEATDRPSLPPSIAKCDASEALQGTAPLGIGTRRQLEQQGRRLKPGLY
ncbi:MAG TPA: hypothetical protein VHE36_12865 [Sphingomicrobium sp.]|jgi:hypothetical protein|nr:hypothetical protein [Sphingomicrobium sp.]